MINNIIIGLVGWFLGVAQLETQLRDSETDLVSLSELSY